MQWWTPDPSGEVSHVAERMAGVCANVHQSERSRKRMTQAALGLACVPWDVPAGHAPPSSVRNAWGGSSLSSRGLQDQNPGPQSWEADGPS